MKVRPAVSSVIKIITSWNIVVFHKDVSRAIVVFDISAFLWEADRRFSGVISHGNQN